MIEYTPETRDKNQASASQPSSSSVSNVEEGRGFLKRSSTLPPRLETPQAAPSRTELLSPPTLGGAVGGRDEDDHSWSSSLSSEDSDIFVRERDFVKFVPVPYPSPTATMPTPTEDLEADLKAVAGAAVMTVTCEGSDSIIGYKPPSIQPTEIRVTTESLQTSPQLSMLRVEEGNDCGSDAEADVFFRHNSNVDSSAPKKQSVGGSGSCLNSDTDRMTRLGEGKGSVEVGRVGPGIGCVGADGRGTK